MECKNPALYLAPEIWEVVFDKLQFLDRKNLKASRVLKSDVYTCYRTCTSFKTILEETKSIWILFEIAPLLDQYISKDTLLICRLVCKSWRHGIDNFIENSWLVSNTHNQHQRSYSTIPSQICQKYTFATPACISNFINLIEDHSQNPFIGKTLNIYCKNLDEQKDFWNSSVTFLLNFFGHYVHHLKLNLRFENDVLSRLESILELTPNLISLTLGGHILMKFSHEQYFHEEFVPLKNLQYLFITSKSTNSEKMASVFPSMLQYQIAKQFSMQLKQLQINFADNYSNQIVYQRKLRLAQIENIDVIVSSEAHLNLLFPLSSSAKCVAITLKQYNPDTVYKLGILLGQVKNLTECLKSLVIKTACKTEVVTNQELEELQKFIKLKHLTLIGFEFLLSSNIVEYFPKQLRTLEMNSGAKLSRIGESVVSRDIPGLESQKRRIVMWQGLPHLQSFKLYDFYNHWNYEYTRNPYDLCQITAKRLSDGKVERVVKFDMNDGSICMHTDLENTGEFYMPTKTVRVMLCVMAGFVFFLFVFVFYVISSWMNFYG